MSGFDRRQNIVYTSVAIAAVAVAAMALVWRVDPRVGQLWLNTTFLAGGACLVALPLGALLAVAVFKTNVPGRGPVAWLLVGMLFVPLYVVTGAWDAGFGIQGWHTLTTNPHLAHQPWLSGWRAAVWVHGLAAVPWVVLVVGAGLRAVEAEVEEDAATCASPFKVLWHVSIRRAAPSIAVAAVWIATIVMTEISVTDFFQVRTFAEEVYTQSALGTFDGGKQGTGNGEQGTGNREQERGESSKSNFVLPAPSSAHPAFPALGLWSGLLLSALVALAVIVGVSRVLADVNESQQREPWIWRMRAGRWPAAALLWCGMLVLVGVPIANLMYKAGIHVLATDSGRVRIWSLAKAIERVAAAPGDFSGELWLSSWIGAAAATAALAIALPIAWSMRGNTSSSLWKRLGERANWRWLPLLVITLSLTIPGPLLGLGVIRLLDQPPHSPLSGLAWLYDSNFAPWLVQTVRALPLAMLILWPALASIPQVMLDAAAMEGTGWWGRLLWIAVPQRWAAMVVAWLVAFAIAAGELAATVLVMPPQSGATALSIQIFQLLHYGVDDRVAAICLVMVFAIAAVTGIAGVLLKRKYG
jgi:iron(III) transport system permease protein